MSRHFVRLLVCALVVSGALHLASPVSAGTYDVSICRANTTGNLPGWSHSETTGSSGGLPYWYQSQDCNGYGVYRRFQINSLPSGAVNDWTFTAPANTTVSSFYHDGTATPTGAGAYDAIFAYSPTGKQAIAIASSALSWNGQPAASSIGSRLFSMPANTLQVQLEVGCAASSCPGTDTTGGYSNAWMWAGGYIRLNDDLNPVIDSVSGPGWEAMPIDGKDSVDYRVSDKGAGVQRVHFFVDGVKRETQLANCEPAGVALVPCPLSASGSFTLDTTQLSEGPHLVAVTVEDASGNVTAQSDQTKTITVRRLATITSGSGGPAGSETNGGGTTHTGIQGPAQSISSTERGAPNGTNASVGAKLTALISGRASTMRVGYGKKVTITGRLRAPNGEAITGARLTIQRKVKAVGARFTDAGSVTTSNTGRFTYVAPVGPSRTIRLAYQAFENDTSFTSTTDIQLLVKGAVTLRASKRVRNGSKALFLGVVKGRPIPSGGILVDLQVRLRKRWRTFATPRTNSRGAYKFRYRFTQGAATWRFRARNRHDSAHPYELSYSRSVTVRVTG